MKSKWLGRFLIGLLLFAAYELLLGGSGVGIRQRWNKRKARADKT